MIYLLVARGLDCLTVLDVSDEPLPDHPPPAFAENHDGDRAVGQILLLADVDRHPVFQILEDHRNRSAGAFEDPGAAHLFWDALDDRTPGPIALPSIGTRFNNRPGSGPGVRGSQVRILSSRPKSLTILKIRPEYADHCALAP